MKIALAGVPFSDNLGDLAIHRCLHGALQALRPDINLVSLDISARTSISSEGSRRKQWLVRILVLLPKRLRAYAVRLQLRRTRQARLGHYQNILEGCQSLLIGGGQLLQDNDANFPTKLSELIGVAQSLGIPYAFIAVGVANRWGAYSRKLLLQRLRAHPPVGVYVRDQVSQQAFTTNFPGDPDPVFCPDPALAANLHLIAPMPIRKRRIIGLNLLEPEEAAHLDGRDLSYARALRKSMKELVHSMAAACKAENAEFLIFTNGAAGDNQCVAALTLETGNQDCFHAVHSLEQLTGLISSLDCLLAFRLHASILASSYGVPVVGIEWDAKVKAFYDLIDGASRVIPTYDLLNPDGIASALRKLFELSPADRRRQSVCVKKYTEIFETRLNDCLRLIAPDDRSTVPQPHVMSA